MKNLTLNNGETATFMYVNDWGAPVYKLENGLMVCCSNCDGSYLHTMIGDYDEPDRPLKRAYQPVQVS